MSQSKHASRRGPDCALPEDKREHCVSVRLNQQELWELDRHRGPYRRGEWMRMAAFGNAPRQVPEVNRTAWVELARLAANLNQYQAAINAQRIVDPDPALLPDLVRAVTEVRMSLIGADQ